MEKMFKMTNVGFIGLGVMGRPMVGHLIAAGYPLYAYSRSGVPAELINNGAIVCSNSSEVAECAEILITMLPDTSDVETVLFGSQGVIEGLTRGKIVVDMSSISPIATKDFARRIAKKGCSYLDAPVSGGEIGARTATLTIMVGGSPEIFEHVRPLFEVLGRNVTLIGENGDGQTAKIANQIIVALTVEAVGEALLFASKAGANPAKVRQALMGGFASSKILEVHGSRMIERNFEPGFRIELHRKDLNLALEGARKLALSLPNTAACQELFNSAVAAGGARWDHSGLVRVLEKMANHELATKT
jgi:2-hydroxy-3-oxopropionate reductase